MTPDQAYDLARYQRPGVRLIVGATEAREEPVKPLDWRQMKDLPGDRSWFDHDIRKLIGRPLSLWELIQIKRIADQPE